MTSALDQRGLKPCPFCGKQPNVTERAGTLSDGATRMCFIVCMCGGYSAHAHQAGQGRTTEEAFSSARAAWNRRSTVIPAEIAGVVEELRGLDEEAFYQAPATTYSIVNRAATLIERLAASQAETRRQALEEVEAQAEQIMLDVANEWHRQIGIDEVLKSKLVKRIADTVATGVFSKRLRALIDQPSTEGGMDD